MVEAVEVAATRLRPLCQRREDTTGKGVSSSALSPRSWAVCHLCPCQPLYPHKSEYREHACLLHHSFVTSHISAQRGEPEPPETPFPLLHLNRARERRRTPDVAVARCCRFGRARADLRRIELDDSESAVCESQSHCVSVHVRAECAVFGREPEDVSRGEAEPLVMDIEVRQRAGVLPPGSRLLVGDSDGDALSPQIERPSGEKLRRRHRCSSIIDCIKKFDCQSHSVTCATP